MVEAKEIKPMPVLPILLDAERTAEVLCVGRRTLDRMLAAGELPRPVSLQSRKRYWRWEDLARWARNLPTLAA